MMELLQATDVPLGLMTSGEEWMLVFAPRGDINLEKVKESLSMSCSECGHPVSPPERPNAFARVGFDLRFWPRGSDSPSATVISSVTTSPYTFRARRSGFCGLQFRLCINSPQPDGKLDEHSRYIIGDQN
jgi:hypothetical protein